MTHVGIIDIGSNSMRLMVVALLEGGAHQVVDEYKSSPRLAARLSPDGGELLPEGVEDLCRHLAEFVDICRAHRVGRTLVLGTAALRVAANRDSVLATIRTRLGLEVEVISGDAEARLDYQAVRHTLAVESAYLVDIGGGSTELTLVEEGRTVGSASLPFGAVTVSAGWRDSQALGRGLALPEAADERLAALSLLRARPGTEVIGIGGTVRTIARLHQAGRRYPLPLTHNYEMAPDDVEALLRRLADTPLRDRRRMEGLGRDRADLIVPGGAILLATLRRTRARRLRVSGRGIRDGALHSRILGDDGDGPVDVVGESVANVLARFAPGQEDGGHVAELALALFDEVARHGLLPKGARSVQYVAARLHRIGVYVNYYGADRHTFHLVLSSPIYGLSHRESVLAALAASFKGRGQMRRLAQPVRTLLTDADLQVAARLGVITRLAEALDRRHEHRVQGLDTRIGAKTLAMCLDTRADATVELGAAKSLGALVKKSFGRSLELSLRT